MSMMRILIGQTEPITDEKKRRVDAFAESVANAKTRMSYVARPDLAWAVQLEYEVKVDLDFDCGKTHCDDPLSFVTSFCKEAGTGVYYFRGFKNEMSEIFDIDPSLISPQERLLYGLPFCVEVTEANEPTVEFSLDWFNRMSATHYGRSFTVGSYAFEPQNQIGNFFSYFNALLATNGPWNFRFGQNPMPVVGSRFSLA